MQTHSLAFLLLLVLLLAERTIAAGKCYYPDGSEAKDDFPCDPDADDSACCNGGLGNACLSNKLCKASNEGVIRGSCTDQNWASPECADYCLNASTGGTNLISCSNVTAATSYCCDHSDECCDTGVGRFDISPEDPQTWATWDGDEEAYVVVGSLYHAPTTKPFTSTKVSSTTTADSILTETAAETGTSHLATTTGAATLPPTSKPPIDTSGSAPSDSSSSSSSPSSTGLSAGAKLGIGLGVGLGVGISALVISAAACFLWRRHRRNKKKQERELQQQQQQQQPHYGVNNSDGMNQWYSPYHLQKQGYYQGQQSEKAELPGHQSEGPRHYELPG